MFRAADEAEAYALEIAAGQPKSKNKYLEEKKRKWSKDKNIEQFIKLFVVDYSEKILTD